MAKVNGKDDLLTLLGGRPLASSPWHDDIVQMSQKCLTAHVVFSVSGPKAKCDICVGLKRKPGWLHPVIYQIFGPGTWETAYVEAAVIQRYVDARTT